MNDGPLFVHEIDAVSLTIGIVFWKVITWLIEETLKSVQLEFQQRAFIDIASAVDADFAAGPGQITGLVLVQPFSLDHQVAPAQHGFTLHHRVQIGVAKQPLTGYKGRQRTA